MPGKPPAPTVERRTIGHVFTKRLHVGIENELAGYELVLLGRRGADWEFQDIGYGKQVAFSVGKSPVHNLPLAQIQVEGAADHKTGLPEHISGPLRTNTTSFESMRTCLEKLTGAFRFWVADRPMVMNGYSVQLGGKVYVFLRHIIEAYNQQLENMAMLDRGDVHRYRLFKLKLDEPSHTRWAVTRKATHQAGKLNTQANIEVPFRIIGQPSGGVDLADQFTSGNKRLFLACRRLATAMVQTVFAADRQRVTGKTGPVKLEKLNSLFTLYYFAICMQAATRRQGAVQQRLIDLGQTSVDRAEAQATAAKSRWELLPKVEWKELMKNALSSDDRAVLKPHIASPVKWATLTTRLNQDLLDASLGLNLSGGELNAFHDKIIKTQEQHLSSTGKPLPVERYAAQKVVADVHLDTTGKVTAIEPAKYVSTTEPVIVFEVRNSGHHMQAIGNPSKPLAPELLRVIDQLQNFAQ